MKQRSQSTNKAQNYKKRNYKKKAALRLRLVTIDSFCTCLLQLYDRCAYSSSRIQRTAAPPKVHAPPCQSRVPTAEPAHVRLRVTAFVRVGVGVRVRARARARVKVGVKARG